nr:hypothetical protein [Wolbachia endosymbiont of Carposina sasakii]
MGNSKINNSANFSMICGSGVYVRSIARDLGIALNCFGHITKLRRTMVGDFRENESVTIEQLTKKNTTTYSPMSSQCLTLGWLCCIAPRIVGNAQ